MDDIFLGTVTSRQPGFGLLGGVAAVWWCYSLPNVSDPELHEKPDL